MVKFTEESAISEKMTAGSGISSTAEWSRVMESAVCISTGVCSGTSVLYGMGTVPLLFRMSGMSLPVGVGFLPVKNGVNSVVC